MSRVSATIGRNNERTKVDLFSDAFDDMNQLDLQADDLTVDQRLKIAEIKALLSISQELSQIHHEGINPNWSSGSK